MTTKRLRHIKKKTKTASRRGIVKHHLSNKTRNLKKGGYLYIPTGYSEFMQNLYNDTTRDVAKNVRRKLLEDRNAAFFAGICTSIAVKNKADYLVGYGPNADARRNQESQVGRIKDALRSILSRADSGMHIYRDEKNTYPLSTLGAFQVIYHRLGPKFHTDSPTFVDSIIRVISKKNKVDMPVGAITEYHYSYQEYLLRNLLLAVTEQDDSLIVHLGAKTVPAGIGNLILRIIGRAGEKFDRDIEGIDKLKKQFEQTKNTSEDSTPASKIPVYMNKHEEILREAAARYAAAGEAAAAARAAAREAAASRAAAAAAREAAARRV